MLLRLTTAADIFNPVVGDLHLTDGQLTLIGEGETLAESVMQDIKAACQFFKGEWFLNQLEGIPYFEQIFVKNPNLEGVKAIFRQVISTRNHVASIPVLTIGLDKRTRTATLTFVAQLTTGQTINSADFSPLVVEF